MSHVHVRTCADQSRDTGTLHTHCHTMCILISHTEVTHEHCSRQMCAFVHVYPSVLRESRARVGVRSRMPSARDLAELRRSVGTEELLMKSSSLLSFWSGRRICSCVGRAAPVGAVCVDGEDDAAFECGSASLRELCCTLLEADVSILESLLTRIVAG